VLRWRTIPWPQRAWIEQGRLVRLLDHSMPMKEAHCLISPEGSLINPAAARAFKGRLMQQFKGA
jgi:DNA-binding transcriptional LysR family regulator